MSWHGTRRAVLRRGALAGTAPVLLLGRASPAAAAEFSEPEIISAAVVLEQRAAFLYRAGLAEDYLRPGLTALTRRLGGHAREHVAVLQTILEAMGGTAPDPPGGVRGLGSVRTQRQFAELAIELESELVAGYHRALQVLDDPKLVQTVGSIMASGGQHLVLLRTALGREPVPSAFETGA